MGVQMLETYMHQHIKKGVVTVNLKTEIENFKK